MNLLFSPLVASRFKVRVTARFFFFFCFFFFSPLLGWGGRGRKLASPEVGCWQGPGLRGLACGLPAPRGGEGRAKQKKGRAAGRSADACGAHASRQRCCAGGTCSKGVRLLGRFCPAFQHCCRFLAAARLKAPRLAPPRPGAVTQHLGAGRGRGRGRPGNRAGSAEHRAQGG